MASAELDGPKAKQLAVHHLLCEEYRCPIAYFHRTDPLSELISALLSHRTRNADSGRAYKALKARYPDWAAVRDAPVEDIQATISGVTWPEQKAPRIKAVLQAVERLAGTLSLDHLEHMDVPEARAWLEQIPGIGPKTSAAVLSFSTLRRAALPVDSHHHRVAVRLGLIPARTAVGPSHKALAALLPPEWDAQQVYDNHEVMMLHGQRCCFFRSPACHRCVVRHMCPTGQARLHGRPVDPAEAIPASAAGEGGDPIPPPAGAGA